MEMKYGDIDRNVVIRISAPLEETHVCKLILRLQGEKSKLNLVVSSC